jgi:para-aminobenzoate synthetase
MVPAGFHVHRKRLALEIDPERAYEQLFTRDRASFWLDSCRAEPGLSRFSFMGSTAGASSLLVTYDAVTRLVTETMGQEVRYFSGSIYTYLDRELARRRCDGADLPFDFNCGFVGYFGYELKSERGATHRHKGSQPDAMFLFADRLVVLDHQERETWLVYASGPGEDDTVAHVWFLETEEKLRKSAACPGQGTGRDERAPSLPAPHRTTPAGPIHFELGRAHARYLDDIARCKSFIRDGETYEVCLTNRIHTTPVADTLGLYASLRRVNPAPYSAYLQFGDVTVMSSSPERFLRIDRDGWIESKPIKGTRPRGKTPEEDARLKEDLRTSEKDRSENLMIVDLLRNDLGIVCEAGSVHVPKLMAVESYQTVHQLVSTIRGRLREGMRAVDAVRHAFPGGSMTGAPKLRTMNILDEIEDAPRGVYSGAIGFLGLNGTADLNIVIRTLVQTPGSASIGVGGAIVMLSDPEQEFDETLLKGRALIHAMVLAARGAVDADHYEAAMKQLRELGHATF